ncbi:unnamed protein product [Linum tenue]|uniref:Uncharacterized protein n=1 Tax=Linum tenue TaxID=586396 RepID=A0AAV0LU80_9ROSI|nr:unnamed protein product [Linum tenue]
MSCEGQACFSTPHVRDLGIVIALTEELLATAKQSEVIGSGIGTRSSVSPTFGQSKELADNSDQYGKFPVGSRVQAVWSEDGEC